MWLDTMFSPLSVSPPFIGHQCHLLSHFGHLLCGHPSLVLMSQLEYLHTINLFQTLCKVCMASCMTCGVSHLDWCLVRWVLLQFVCSDFPHTSQHHSCISLSALSPILFVTLLPSAQVKGVTGTQSQPLLSASFCLISFSIITSMYSILCSPCVLRVY